MKSLMTPTHGSSGPKSVAPVGFIFDDASVRDVRNWRSQGGSSTTDIVSLEEEENNNVSYLTTIKFS